MIETRAFGGGRRGGGQQQEERRDQAGEGHQERQLTSAGQVAHGSGG